MDEEEALENGGRGGSMELVGNIAHQTLTRTSKIRIEVVSTCGEDDDEDDQQTWDNRLPSVFSNLGLLAVPKPGLTKRRHSWTHGRYDDDDEYS